MHGGSDMCTVHSILFLHTTHTYSKYNVILLCNSVVFHLCWAKRCNYAFGSFIVWPHRRFPLYWPSNHKIIFSELLFSVYYPKIAMSSVLAYGNGSDASSLVHRIPFTAHRSPLTAGTIDTSPLDLYRTAGRMYSMYLKKTN